MLYQLSYGPIFCRTGATTGRTPSGQGRNRTTDTAIFSRVLYQLSYLAYKKNRPGLFGYGRSDKEARRRSP